MQPSASAAPLRQTAMQTASQAGAIRVDSSVSALSCGLDSDSLRAWGLVRAHLLSDVGEKTFNSWLKPLQLISIQSGEVHLSVPSRFMADWVKLSFAFWRDMARPEPCEAEHNDSSTPRPVTR